MWKNRLSALFQGEKYRWLVTGAAGFIGSNLTETLLLAGQEVVGFDDFSTGKQKNLDEVRAAVGPERWASFQLIRDTLENADALVRAASGVDFVLHHAALVSVPVSIEEPALTQRVNVEGFRNVLEAASSAGVKRVVYASSAAVYGDETAVPAREERIGKPLSPYAESKRANELIAAEFRRDRSLESVGLRYFNVFGPRQDHRSAYAAVIPSWMKALLHRERVVIFGDGETTRDFCFVGDVVAANLRAALTPLRDPARVVNVAAGRQTSLRQLLDTLRSSLGEAGPADPEYRDFRPGDVRHSMADISLAERLLGYVPGTSLEAGIAASLPWYRQNLH